MDDEKFVNEKVVREIIDTYNLSPKLKEKIAEIALGNIREFFLVSFDEQYRYISELIYKFSTPITERFALNLDARILETSKNVFHKIIGVKDKNLEKIFETEEGLTAHEILDILESKIDKFYLNFVHQLINNSNGNLLLNISQDKILANINQIKENLDELISKYEKDGRLIVPKRPIINVQFNPLSIKFKQRRYNADPLLFFIKNIDTYKGLARSELKKADYGLYQALVRYKQIEQAIPENKRVTYRGYKSPLNYFKAHPELNRLSRLELKKADGGLYETLLRHKQINEAIPEKRKRVYKYRGYENSLMYFKDHPEFNGLSRGELKKIDEALYATLWRHKQLDQAIP